MADQTFSILLSRFTADVRSVKGIVSVHDRAMLLYYEPRPSRVGGVSEAAAEVDLWGDAGKLDLKRPDWRIYDHCAALTRLYALYESFIEDVVSEYLRELPHLYSRYQDLPNSLLKQHRAGCGHVLLKLGESGPFRQIPEEEMDARLLGHYSGEPYSLLKEAFFVDRQNYRGEVLAKLFGYLGMADVPRRLAKHDLMIQFLHDRNPGTTWESELNRFVALRNDAAHGPVEEAVGREELEFFADLLAVLAEALVRIVEAEIGHRRLARGEMVEAGTVESVHYKGRVLIVRMNAVRISVGESVIVGDSKLRELATIESIEDQSVRIDTVAATEGKVLGLGLKWRIRSRPGLAIYKFPSPPEVRELFERAEIAPVAQADSDKPAEGEIPNVTG